MEEQKEQFKKVNPPKTIRTFSSDMAKAVRENEMTVIKIAMAEKDRLEQEEILAKSKGTRFSRTMFFVGGIILIGSALFGSYYFANLKKEKEILIVKEKPRIGTFIVYDNAISIDVSNVNGLMNLVSAIHSKKQEEKSGSNAIFLSKKTSTGGDEIMNKDEFLSILKATAPLSLTRSMSKEFLFGKYVENSQNIDSTAFLIFGINDYNLSYASMLDWEKSIFSDLFILFDIHLSDSDTALFERDWKDVVVNNKDSRVLYGVDGEGILYYSFVNKNTLVITENIEVLKRIINAILIKNPGQ